MRPLALTLAVLTGLNAPAAALQWVPILDSTVLMGQVLADGKASSWQGNANVNFTPAVKFNESFGLIPTYTGSYRGTKSVTELAGGGQLFQDEMVHSLSLKGVYVRDRFKLKPQLGFRWDLLRETKEEKIGQGLFDYQKASAGLEGEWSFDEERKASAALDFYTIRFPNYKSLESQAGAGLGRENAGSRTLDSRSVCGTAGLSGPTPVPYINGSLSLNLTRRDYDEQHVVLASGQLSPELRRDTIRSGTVRLWHGRTFTPKIAGVVSVAMTISRYDSKQNHYDAELNKFNYDFYSYDERSYAPRLGLLLGERKGEFSITYLLTRRQYTGRPAQNAAGTYLGQAVRLDQNSFVFDLSVPLSGGFRAVAQSVLTKASSNMAYEKTFRYNYTISNHLIGAGYSF